MENDIIYDDIPLFEEQEEVIVEEVMPVIEITETEGYDIEMQEAFPSLEADNSYNHALLHNRELKDAHPIIAITGLREELDEIESLKTIYSDKHNVANYYKWNNAAYDDYGYFVSIVPSTSEIKICDGSDIFGVSIDRAGFIGGQDAAVPRGNSYGLIATSGLVDVRCELEVSVGDYVISNTRGYAKKSTSNFGYKVLAIEEKNGVTYAAISLDVQADRMDVLSTDLGEVKEQVEENYKNIVSAVNVANQAYQKANETEASNQIMSDKVNSAVGKVDEMVAEVGSLSGQVSNSAAIAVQAKAIAESAATSAASMKQEAVASANDAAAKVSELTKTLEPLTTWTDPVTGNKGASYLANYIDNGLATKAEIEDVEDDLEHATSAILQNAKSLQSLVISIDKYSVGERSTAYGLTLDQATSILEPGIIYAPTVSHKEQYSYVDGENTYEYEREFTPGYLYQWGQLLNGRYGWITIDKYYRDIVDINISAPSVYFSAYEIAIGANDDYGYWYTNADTIYDKDGNVTDKYEPRTLYKWIEGQWVAVATVAGNTQSRSISQVRQTANEIEASVTNMKGDVAISKQWIEDNSTNIQDVVTWKGNNAEAIATTIQSASDSEAYIAQVASVKNEDGSINAAASIITAVNNDTSGIVISANHINLKGQVTFESFDEDTKKQIEADTIDVQIWSSRGNIFKSRDVTTILTCHVFKAGVDITDTLPNTAFAWEKVNHDGSVDTIWTATPYGNHANAIQITSTDVFSRAVFNCAVEI